MRQTFEDLKFLLPLGIKYLVIGFAGSFVTNLLTIYSGALLGLKEAAIVNIAQKIFTFFTGIYQSVLNPIWSRLATLYFQKAILKCKTLWNISIVVTLLVAFGIITLSTVLSDVIIRIVAGGDFISSPELFCMVGICLFMKITIGYIIFTVICMGVFPNIVRLWSFRSMIMCMIFLWLAFSLAIYYRTLNKQLTLHG